MAAHEAGVWWVEDHGNPPYVDPEESRAFRAHIAARDAALMARAPSKRAKEDADRVVKAMGAELKYLNAELERMERNHV